jgi:hypothetical protein
VGVEWTHLAQGKDRLRAVVNAVMNLQVLAAWSELVNDVIFNSHKLIMTDKIDYVTCN